MKALFFPANKLNAVISPVYNGHKAVVSFDTDRLKDNKFELAEISLFKYNLQGTSFLNPYGVQNNENADYSGLISKLDKTGRISFGIYVRTDSWINPVNGNLEVIPDYNATVWSSAGAAYFDVTSGTAKTARYPNHGQQFYDLTSGRLGYDYINGVAGQSDMAESFGLIANHINYFYELSGLTLTTGSYENGRTEIARLLIPYMLGLRNSSYSYTGDSNIDNSAVQRLSSISRASSTRSWDAFRSNQFASLQDALTYAAGEIDKALLSYGWFNEFMHWHSLYEQNTPEDFDTIFSAFGNATLNKDIWAAGYNEAVEYAFLRDTIDLVGSFIDGDTVVIALGTQDRFKGTDTNGIPNNVDFSLLQTPVSIEIDLTGTPLSGKDIKCKQAYSIRKLGSNKYIINIPFIRNEESFVSARIEEGTPDYYSKDIPIVTRSGNTFLCEMPCKWVIWKKLISDPIQNIREDSRYDYANSINIDIEDNYNYYIGFINKWRKSSLIEI